MADDTAKSPRTFTFVEPIDLDPAMVHTPIWKGAPDAPVRLVRVHGYLQWQVVRCPYCGEKHNHGTAYGEDPRVMLGGRQAHCRKPPWGGLMIEYRLVAIEGTPSREELDRFFPRVWTAKESHSNTWHTFHLPKRREPKHVMVAADVEPTEDVEITIGIRKTLPRDVRSAVWQKTKGHCYYCGALTDPFLNLHIDHIQPVSDGGSNHPDNLVVACQDCNLSKGARSLEEFRFHRGGGLFWFEVARMGGAS